MLAGETSKTSDNPKEGDLSVSDMQCTRPTPVTLGIANTRMHKIPEKCIQNAWNASWYCARDLSHLARFAGHVLVSVLALYNLGERSLPARLDVIGF
jgi:hypothetical protein